MHCQRNEKLSREELLKEMEPLVSYKDKLYWQYYLYEKALCTKDKKEKLSLFYEALYVTCEDFSFSNIMEYRLSWQELTILNAICNYEEFETPYEDIFLFRKLIEYMNYADMGVILKSNIMPVTISLLFIKMYEHSHYYELTQSAHYLDGDEMKSSIQYLGIAYFYYCQALGECESYDNVKLYANYACEINNLIEWYPNSEALKRYLFEDFGIVID